MCMNTTELDGYRQLNSTTFIRRRKSKRLIVQVHRLHRKRREMEMKNLKLYMENQCIIQENEKLRLKALLLHQENTALLSLIHNKH